MATCSRINKLAEKVESQYLRDHDGQTFLPEDQLHAFILESSVRDVLQDAGLVANDVDDLVQFVCNKDLERSGRRLFLILVMMTDSMEKLSFLEQLKANGVDDSALPIHFFGGKYNGQGYRLEHPDHSGSESNRFPIFAQLSRNERHLFDSHQWNFLAPVFGIGRFRSQFSRQRRLPYLRLSPQPVSSGFFGEVSQAVVVSSHVPNLQVSDFLGQTAGKALWK